MDPASFIDLQEALLYVFAPILVQFLILLAAGGILSMIGVIVLGLAARLTRG